MLEWMAVYNAVMTEDRFSYLFAALAPSDVIPAEKIYAHLLRCANKPEL